MANRLLTVEELTQRVADSIAKAANEAGVPEEELIRALAEAYPYGMIG